MQEGILLLIVQFLCPRLTAWHWKSVIAYVFFFAYLLSRQLRKAGHSSNTYSVFNMLIAPHIVYLSLAICWLFLLSPSQWTHQRSDADWWAAQIHSFFTLFVLAFPSEERVSRLWLALLVQITIAIVSR